MPKYKPHKFIQGIEHKHCGSICKKWKPLDQFGRNKGRPDGKYFSCKSCKNKIGRQHNHKYLQQRKKARQEAPNGHSVCLLTGCTVKDWLQSVDQFIGSHTRKEELTDSCLTCRNKMKKRKKRREALYQKVWDDWRKMHPCIKCMNDSNYEHNYLLIEADHLPEFKKVKECSDMGFWSRKDRGLAALRAELMKVEALCRFHHRLQTQQRNRDNGKIVKKPYRLRKRGVINEEKHKRGCCLLCKRPVIVGEESAFDFDHRDDSTKFMYNGKSVNISDFVDLPKSLFTTQWTLEQAKCDLLCANCHRLKTKKNKDGYKKLNVKK